MCPQHEYTAEAWKPYNITTADGPGHIQHAADRFVHHDYQCTLPVNNIIYILGRDYLHIR